MNKIIFICHGNICRSPMAEFIFKDLAKKAGREKEFKVSSAAVSDEEEGNGLYPPARRKLIEKGVPFENHHAHRITADEYAGADLVVVMDDSNLRLLRRLAGDDRDGKVHKLTEYSGLSRDVADPWYTGDFEAAWFDIFTGCAALLSSFAINAPGF